MSELSEIPDNPPGYGDTVGRCISFDLGKVLADAMRFCDLAAGEGLMLRHDAGFYLDAADICVEFAKASGVELGSPEYEAAVAALARSA
jgi:hypothetical protein